MEYALLGPTGVQVSKICVGTATFGVVPSERDATRVVQAALDLGVNFFDTANVYGTLSVFDRPGAPPAAEREPAETILGRALTGRRDEVVLATLSAYHDLIAQGKTRYVALSNHPAWQVTHALWIADDRRLAAAPVCTQVKYNLIDRAAERELAPACERFGLSIVPYSPLHGGLLAGTQVQQREVHGDQRFGGPGFSEAELAIGREVERLSQEWGLRPYQVSLAWLLSRPAVASVIVGAETVEEITANASATDVVLEQAQIDALTELRPSDNT